MDKQNDLILRLQTEADLCRNDGAGDIAALLDEAVEAIRDRNHDTQVGEKWREDSRLETWFPLTAERLSTLEADAKRLDWLMANSGLILGHGWWALKTYADTAPEDPLGVLDWIDAVMLQAEEADARNQELAARNFTGYAELEDWLRGQGFEISKSAIHRYGQKIERRMAAALDELSHYAEFDYLVINDRFETALTELREKESELHTIVSTLEEMERFMRESGKGARR